MFHHNLLNLFDVHYFFCWTLFKIRTLLERSWQCIYLSMILYNSQPFFHRKNFIWERKSCNWCCPGFHFFFTSFRFLWKTSFKKKVFVFFIERIFSIQAIMSSGRVSGSGGGGGVGCRSPCIRICYSEPSRTESREGNSTLAESSRVT